MIKQQVSWKRQNKSLDEDAEQNIQLKKQINKQTDMDSLIQNSINDKIYQLKSEATQITKKLENQKYKNMELETIIKTIKCRMEDQKKTQASSFTDANFQNIQTLQRKIKKLQYDLDQINTRANKMGSIVSDKKHKISLLRTQRVIDSNIFRNIQKQLINSEMQFKKLLIQKIKYQKTYEQSLNEYNSLKSKAQQYFQNQQTQRKSQSALIQNYQQQSYLVEEGRSVNASNKFKQLQRMPSQYRNNSIQSDLRREQQGLYYQFKVKKFLMNLNLNNGKEFIYNYHNIDNINDQYFSTLNSTGDLITELQEEIKQIEAKVKQNTIKFYKPKTNFSKNQKEFLNCRKIKKQVQKYKVQAFQQVKSLNQFMDTQNFKKVTQSLQISENLKEDMDFETLIDFLKNLQKKMSKLSYHQIPRLNDESMILKTGRSERQKKEQKIEDVMGRIKVYEQSDKIMKRQQFKQEYRRIMQAGPVTGGSRPNLKKKTKKVIL